MGNNWVHNFDLSLLDLGGGDVSIFFEEGRLLRFQKPAASWVLQEPTDIPFQLVESGSSFILGVPSTHLLYTFDAAGLLTEISDGKGNTLTLSYEGPVLKQVTDGLGRTLSFTNEGLFNISSVTDGTRTIEFTHAFTGISESNLTSVADAKGLAIYLEVDVSALGWRIGDRRMLLRVLLKLVSNAVKFTDVGGVGIRARPKGERVLFEVEDTGGGVPPELQSRIFDRFVQADGSMARRSGGTGLGLAVAWQLAEAMGGTIGVESHEGAGSRFWFEVPLRAVAPSTL